MGWSWAQRAVSLAVVAGSSGVGGVQWAPAERNRTARDGNRAAVVVETRPGSEKSVAAAIRARGGTAHPLGIVPAVAAKVPRASLARVARLSGVTAVVPDRVGRLFSDDPPDALPAPAVDDAVSMASTIAATGATEYRAAGLTGAGVGIALIDSGVTRVAGLDAPGQVVDGPDFTADAADPLTAHRDFYGHGTHMAGIIAGADRRATDGFSGMAPAARIVNVKIADRSGKVSTSQVIAAIAWVVTHPHFGGVAIRVINLSYGTNGGAEPALDPLDQAVEAAWRRGITVVVAAGNGGASTRHLSNPARDPLVLAVGASDSASRAPDTDVTLGFSSRGDGGRNPDLVAPGRSVASARVPGSLIDTRYPSARVSTTLFRGSGTSQAAAVVTGATALVVQQHPEATPDQVKALLDSTAMRIEHGGDATAQGHGVIDLAAAIGAALPAVSPPPVDLTPDGHPLAIVFSHGTMRVTLIGGTVVARVGAVAGPPTIELNADEVSGGLTGSSWSDSGWADGTWSGSSWS